MRVCEPGKSFNGVLKAAIDETITGVLGQMVHEALYRRLEKKYSVTSDELPYRFDTMCEVLRNTFGIVGSKTLGRAIARNLYRKIGIQFSPRAEYTLTDYVREAKAILAA